MAFIAIAAWLAFQWLRPEGLGWIVPLVGALGAFAWIAYRYVRIRRHRAEDAQADRWAEALMDPPLRPTAIRELRERIRELDGSASRRTAHRARLALVLAELLEADGEPHEALAALEPFDVTALPERTAAMVRHARAVASLSAGDLGAAEAELDDATPSGDRGVDLRMLALRGAIAAQRRDGERALEIAEELRLEAANDPDLRTEARVLKALGLDALGDRDEAVKVMRALGEEMLGVLLVLGLPRVKALADLALDDDL
jgi:hypothetical protein